MPRMFVTRGFQPLVPRNPKKLKILFHHGSFCTKQNMYRYRDKSRGSGFVFGVRSVVLRDNDNESSHDKYSHAYTQNALRSYKHEEQYNIKKNLENQQSQIQYRNLFNELPQL